MTDNMLHYFACGNTSKGFTNFFPSNLQGLKKIFILKGGPGTGKSSLMKKAATKYSNQGFHIEVIHCSSDSTSLDGVIISDIGVAIVDGTSPHVIEPEAPGAIEEYVNLGIAWDSSLLEPYTSDILSIKNQISKCYTKAYQVLAGCLTIHDSWEEIYISHMNFDKAKTLTEHTISLLLQDFHLDKLPITKHRFLGAATPIGAVDFVDNLTKDLGKRYFIKGRPGSGKSTLMKQFQQTAKQRGFDTEVYHCGFDPDSLDMVIIRELDLCIFDSTSPHEYFPKNKNDHIIDMYAECITPNTDTKYANELSAIAARYKQGMEAATHHLAHAKSLHDELEAFYIRAIDFNKIDLLTNDLFSTIDSYCI